MLNETAVQDARELAELFRLFSVETRVRIVELLRGRALCVGALAGRLGVSSAAISQHLRILRVAGLVEREQRGVYAHYRLNPERMAQCRRAMASLLRRPDAQAAGCADAERPSSEGSAEDV